MSSLIGLQMKSTGLVYFSQLQWILPPSFKGYSASQECKQGQKVLDKNLTFWVEHQNQQISMSVPGACVHATDLVPHLVQ